jgi:hypothetical protein
MAWLSLDAGVNDPIRGSPMGRVCRETTPVMVARVTAALE